MMRQALLQKLIVCELLLLTMMLAWVFQPLICQPVCTKKAEIFQWQKYASQIECKQKLKEFAQWNLCSVTSKATYCACFLLYVIYRALLKNSLPTPIKLTTFDRLPRA